ncbi:hypothetical protein HY642_02215 [Candidatus Woesearchaeota archaeon]|nr:hypothetical protein [Candidatus Woesearchaeota archaeon]
MAKKNQGFVVAVLVVVVIAVALWLGAGTTGASVKGGDDGGSSVESGQTNFLAAKVFPVGKKVCVKKPQGADWYAVFQGSLTFDPNSIPFFNCNKNTDCKALLGSDARCVFVKHIVVPEYGVIVQNQQQAVCGNGRVETGEECDPPNGVTCDANCRRIEQRCGDGIVQSPEQCDPPNGVTCDSNCMRIEIKCGDGVIQPPETCEPPGGTCATASGVGTCSNDCKVCSIAAPCPPGQILCDTKCVDPATDPNNCGSCNNVCPAGSQCVDKGCTPTTTHNCAFKCKDGFSQTFVVNDCADCDPKAADACIPHGGVGSSSCV